MEEQTQNTYYRSSGKVSLLKAVPLLGVTLLVALIMAFVLLICDAFNFYYFIFIPLIVGAPVFGMLYATLHFGACRNRIFGVACALLCMFVYYFGFWTFGYLINVVAEGPDAVRYMEHKAGAKGVIGYIIFRCRTNIVSDDTYKKNDHTPDGSDAFGSILFYSMELLLLFGAASAMGINLPGRVFYEHIGKWASKIEIRLIPQELAKALNAIRNNQWQDFSTIPKLPKIGNNQGFNPYLNLKFEFLKDSTSEPIYVSLSGFNISKDPVAKAEGAKGPGKAFIKKMRIPGQFYPALALTFPEIGLDFPHPATVTAPIAAAVSDELQKREAPRASTPPLPVCQPKYSDGFKGFLEKAGLSQPEITGPDFREKAAENSIKLMKKAGEMASPTDINKSLCFPVDDNEKLPTKEVSGINYWSLLLFFVCFLGGLMLLAFGEDKADPIKTSLMITGGIICVIGFFCLFIGLGGRNFRAPAKFLNRPNALFDRYSNQQKEILRIENPRTYHISKGIPEDVCYCLYDQQNSRLLLEGCNYRYIIKGEDVSRLEPLETGQVVSIHLSYKIQDEELPLIVYKASAGGTVLNPLLTMNAAKSFVKKIRKALNMES